MKIQDYIPIVGRSTIEELYLLAEKLSGKVVLNVNSTLTGGGVAEILNRMVPLLNQLGVDARWEVIKGNDRFFQVTKKFHNALHGLREDITPEDFDVFADVSRKNIDEVKLNGDVFFIHDPQPIMLVNKRNEVGGKWLWRCHIDISHAEEKVWRFLRDFVVKYDAAVFTAPSFSRELPVRQFMIAPSIDPLSDKNRDLPTDTIEAILAKYHIGNEKPIVTQISRFDRLKDPVGVIQAFEQVRRSFDCQLILAGGSATDDPESEEVLKEVEERAGGNPDIHILTIPPNSDMEINALQRASTIIVQKSLREGFGLTVTEALWKAKPVVATAVGGIPLQVRNKFTGLISHGIEGTAYAIKQLLSNPEYARSLGQNGREHVKQNFLITRHLAEYMLLFLALGRQEEIIYL
ncbi:MAG: glycosyl transferase family 1 [Dehalococcoidia bacterium]|nr:glycosyl transferase family 1 [Dehalococcoidia bacterium]